MLSENTLYYGDNLPILRNYLKDESVDLIYLDPPFNSKASYNLLFKEPAGEASKAQITAFEDTWHWNEEVERSFQEIVKSAPASVVEMMRSFRQFVGLNDMMAYLTMMCVRLLELKRVLKESGSIYLHCDPTASHYLKILMDTVFGKRNFRNEIVWKRATMSGGKAHANQYGRNHDVLLYYSKGETTIFKTQHLPYSEEYIKKNFIYSELDGRIYRLQPCGTRTKEGIEEFRRMGRIVESRTGYIKIKFYLDEMPGVALDDIWIDIKDIRTTQREKLGYPTQKPTELLERIIRASSNEGDIVLDPFCGCGTTIITAQDLYRNWIGIDITHLAVNLIKWRLKSMFDVEPKLDYRVIGEPEDLSGAKELAALNRYQFQWWALSLIDARAYGDKKKGADSGIDGYIYFMDAKNEYKKIVVQVKSGKVSVKDIRDLGHVIERENAAMGIFITLEEPTKPMISEAAGMGFYQSQITKREYPKLQICAITDLLKGQKPNIPEQFKIASYKEADRVFPKNQNNIFDE